MRFLAELSGNRFKYGDFISKTNDYDLVFANYDTEYITRMGGSYELNSVIPAHGNRFAITSAKYTEPFSDEFEIVNLNGVIPENRVGEICEKLFMNGIGYKKLQYYGLSFKFKIKVDIQFNFVNKNYIVLYNLPEQYRPREREVVFNVTGSHNELILFIQSNGNVGLRTASGALSSTTETQNTIIEASGSYIPCVYPININVNLNHNTLQGYALPNDNPRTSMQEGSELISFSPTYLNCTFTDPEAIEGGVNGQWGTIGFKFTLTADSQFCWEDKTGFSMSSDSSYTFYSGDAATIIPPKITVTMKGVPNTNGGTTLYTSNGKSHNAITFNIGSPEVKIDIPDNKSSKICTISVLTDHTLKFIIDPTLRQVYGEDIDDNEDPKKIIGYPYGASNIPANSLASVFKGFKIIPKGNVNISIISGNISSITFGNYTVGYLI